MQASNHVEELVIVHNLDIRDARQVELADFNYEFDVRQVYRSISDGVAEDESLD